LKLLIKRKKEERVYGPTIIVRDAENRRVSGICPHYLEMQCRDLKDETRAHRVFKEV